MANWTATQPASNGPGDREPQGGEAVSEVTLRPRATQPDGSQPDQPCLWGHGHAGSPRLRLRCAPSVDRSDLSGLSSSGSPSWRQVRSRKRRHPAQNSTGDFVIAGGSSPVPATRGSRTWGWRSLPFSGDRPRENRGGTLEKFRNDFEVSRRPVRAGYSICRDLHGGYIAVDYVPRSNPSPTGKVRSTHVHGFSLATSGIRLVYSCPVSRAHSCGIPGRSLGYLDRA
jgi:hypothetical protein